MSLYVSFSFVVFWGMMEEKGEGIDGYMKKEKKCKMKNVKSVLGGIVIGIALFVVCLFLVQIPYWVGTFWSPIKSDLTPSDILGFLGDFLSAAGTVVLGIIAVKQTERANNISDRVLQLEEKIYDEAHKPKLAIGNTKLYSPEYYNTAMNKEYSGKLYWVESTKKKNLKAEDGFIEFVLTNRGSSGLYGCKLVSIRSTPDELKSHVYNIGDSKATPFDLAPDKSINICLKLYTESIDRFAK